VSRGVNFSNLYAGDGSLEYRLQNSQQDWGKLWLS